MKLVVPFANACDDTWVSHIVYSLGKRMAAEPEVDLELVVASINGALVGDKLLREPVPGWLHWLLYRLDPDGRWLAKRHAALCSRRIQGADIVWFWPDNKVPVYDQARAAGSFVAHEMINCHLGTVRRIMDAESAAIGVPIKHDIDQARIDEEDAWLERSDLVFAPSPLVKDSLIENGVPAAKICLSSYGWSPERIRTGVPRPEVEGRPRLVFVGRLSLRKGVHLLLDAFERLSGAVELVFCGEVSEEVEAFCGPRLRQAGIEVLGHVDDVSAVLDKAHLFALPSLEEGSPLVTYEAMAKGLPVICSPMGGGGVVRDGVEGYLVDPHDAETMAARIAALAEDSSLRRDMGAAAAARALDFTWDQVAMRRLAAMQRRGGDALPDESESLVEVQR